MQSSMWAGFLTFDFICLFLAMIRETAAYELEMSFAGPLFLQVLDPGSPSCHSSVHTFLCLRRVAKDISCPRF
jgi:hypothetical protein